MSGKSWRIALILLAFCVPGALVASGAGHGPGISHPGGKGPGGPAAVDHHGNSEQCHRPENGGVGFAGSFENGSYGWGGLGYGLGCGFDYGYGCPGWAYGIEGVPYFAQFPPVYYGYGDNMPVVKSSIRSSWAGSEAPLSAAEPAAPAGVSRPPLRIINPYYHETQADKP